MSDTPFFSIVLPTYNRAHIVSKPIKSVIEQSFTSWELLVIDDGSTDNTKDIVTAFGHSQIRYIYQQNAERSAARNNGIRNARGTYVCFLDSDDSYTDNHLDGLYRHIMQTGNQKALYLTNRIIHVLNTEKQIKESFKTDNFSSPQFFLKETVVPGMVCIEASILKNYMFDEKIVVVEDTDLWLRIACYYPVFHVPNYTFIYSVHEENSINVKNNAYKQRLDGLKKTFKKIEANKVDSNLKRKILSDCYFGIQRYYVARNEYFKARISMLEALIKYPEIRWKEKVYLLINPTSSLTNNL